MWIARLVLLGLLFALVGVSSHFLKHRSRYEGFREGFALNLLLVVVYSLLCYLPVGLPSDPRIISAPAFLTHPVTRTGFSIVGPVLIVSGVLMIVIAILQRRTLGGQEVKAGLLTSGIYRCFRHPIYTGVVWISLGLPLTTRNLDGLLLFPGVLLANVAQAAAEEKWDIGARFQVEYEEYRKRTRMFGPVWFWVILLGSLLALVGVPYLLRP